MSRGYPGAVRIGELAHLVGVPPKTIRYYEAIGILPPPPRTRSGYRDYGPEAVSRLAFVRAAQSIGLSLGEIREVLAFRDRGEAPCLHVAALIERHARELAERIAALERMRRDLERLARRARALRPAPPREGEVCHLIQGEARRPQRAGAHR
jgi:MerR family copper efflux transcriptional regulator